MNNDKEKEIRKEDPNNKVAKLPVTVTLTFKSEVLRDKKGSVVYKKKQDDNGKPVNDLENPEFERNDIETFLIFLNSADVAKIKLDEERQLLLVTDKIKERWKAGCWDCEIDFSLKEADFIRRYLENVKDKVRQTGTFTAYHSKTKFALLDQLIG